jgi:hypothetical protein
MFLYSHWLKLPITTRIKIADKFKIEKKGSTHVFNNMIQTDGFNIRDVEEALSVTAMQEFIGDCQETDSDKLWTMFIDKMEGKLPIETTEKLILKDEMKAMAEDHRVRPTDPTIKPTLTDNEEKDAQSKTTKSN